VTTLFLCSTENVFQRRLAPFLLDSNYFCVDRQDLSEGLQWGEGKIQGLTKEKFKALMHIELRKSAPFQKAKCLCFTVTDHDIFRFLQRNMLKAEETGPPVDILAIMQVHNCLYCFLAPFSKLFPIPIFRANLSERQKLISLVLNFTGN
jgi:hypothetical protein